MDILYHKRLSVCARRAQIILEGFIVVIHGICQGQKDRLALSKGYHHNPTESRFLELTLRPGFSQNQAHVTRLSSPELQFHLVELFIMAFSVDPFCHGNSVSFFLFLF